MPNLDISQIVGQFLGRLFGNGQSPQSSSPQPTSTPGPELPSENVLHNIRYPAGSSVPSGAQPINYNDPSTAWRIQQAPQVRFLGGQIDEPNIVAPQIPSNIGLRDVIRAVLANFAREPFISGTPMWLPSGNPFQHNISSLLPPPGAAGPSERSFWRERAL
jgi:hypothetical protein